MLGFTAVGLAALSLVAAAPVARDVAPSAWAHGYLEDYETYHARYLAIKCQDQHNTTFFTDCCHPLLSNETVENDRLAYCVANATASSSAAAFTATAVASASGDDSDDVYCESTSVANESTTIYESAPASTATSTSTAAWSSAVESSAPESAANLVQVAAKSSTSKWVAPSTTSTSEWVAPSTTSSEAPAATSAASSDVKTGGFATYFYQGGNPGACGTYHSDSDAIVAIDSTGYWSDYASNSNNANCGKWLTITNTNNGKSVTAQVADVCPTCVSTNSLDLSVGAFTAIASEGDGMVPITWVWA